MNEFEIFDNLKIEEILEKIECELRYDVLDHCGDEVVKSEVRDAIDAVMFAKHVARCNASRKNNE